MHKGDTISRQDVELLREWDASIEFYSSPSEDIGINLIYDEVCMIALRSMDLNRLLDAVRRIGSCADAAQIFKDVDGPVLLDSDHKNLLSINGREPK